MHDTTLVARQLSKHYGAFSAVSDINFELRRGEVLGFLGPNGAGKSTTLKMLSGVLAPTEGSVSVCGSDLLEQPRQAKAKLGYLPENPPLYRHQTVDEYLTLTARLRRLPKADIAAAVRRAKERCGLGDAGKKLVGHLSKGYQQRVGIAQAIVHNPGVVILDEPTSGLDPLQIRDIRALIRELGNEHSVLLSTHILSEAESLCDRVQIIHRGKLVFSDSVAGLKTRRDTSAFLVDFAQPPGTEGLLALPGIRVATGLENGLFRVEGDPGANLAETLAKAAAEHGWGLRLLQPSHPSLEEVFVKLAGNPQEAGS